MESYDEAIAYDAAIPYDGTSGTAPPFQGAAGGRRQPGPTPKTEELEDDEIWLLI